MELCESQNNNYSPAYLSRVTQLCTLLIIVQVYVVTFHNEHVNCLHYVLYTMHTEDGMQHSFQEQLLQHLSVHEYNCLMHTSGATDYDNLRLFVR